MLIRALGSAATGMRAQQFNIDSIANDLTNVNTTGYKKKYVSFQDLFYQSTRASGLLGNQGNNTPTGIQVGNGVRVTGTTPVFTQGGALQTNIPTHMMIQDKGNVARNFFQVNVNGQIRYTRDGTFIVDDQGQLATTGGLLLDPPITIPNPTSQVDITEEGLVMVIDENGVQTNVGQIQLATFANPAGLSPQGSNLFAATEASGTATTGNAGDGEFGKVIGGWLETSNVDAITQMVNMITAQRAYEFNSRSIQASDEMLQTVNNLKR